MESQNILIYGARGFPTNLLWELVFRKKYGDEAVRSKKKVMWNNKISYTESPFFFECDMADPHNPTDLQIFANFIKDLIEHKCVYNIRHTVVLQNIDHVCSKDMSHAFRVFLERFSNNVMFICTTHRISRLEPPLVSRCLGIRVPLPTPLELAKVFGNDGLDVVYNPLLIKNTFNELEKPTAP
jgi:DNA polymerase III delta prime subunit